MQLAERLQACKVFVLLIGRSWLHAVDAQAQPRLHQHDDVHRLEVATALARSDVLVIPLLLDDAPIPSVDALPPDLKALCNRQARRLHDAKAHQGLVMNALAADISKASGLPMLDLPSLPTKPEGDHAKSIRFWMFLRPANLVAALATTFIIAVAGYVGGAPLPEGAHPLVFAASLGVVVVARTALRRWSSRRSSASTHRR